MLQVTSLIGQPETFNCTKCNLQHSFITLSIYSLILHGENKRLTFRYKPAHLI